MCGRFELNASLGQIVRQFSLLKVPSLPNLSEFRPTDMALVILGARHAELRTWGIPAPWQGKGNGKPIFNARSETLMEKSVFSSFLAHRCIVPATAFPEWQKDGKRRYRHRISLLKDKMNPYPIMAFAGLYDENHFTIITCPACEIMAPVHNRMPVILPPKSISSWLNPEINITETVKLLIPYSGDDLLVEQDNIRNNEADAAQPDLFY